MARMWIGDEWADAADGRVFEVVNPSNEEVVDTAPRAGAADVDRAVAAAARAFPEWRRTPGIERAEKLHHAARRIRDDREGSPSRSPRKAASRCRRTATRSSGSPPASTTTPRSAGTRSGRVISPGGPPTVQLRHQGALRRRRADRPLELSPAPAVLEARPGAGRGQHGGREAQRAHAAVHDSADAAPSRTSPPAWSTSSPATATRRGRAGRAPGRRGRRLHGQPGHRPQGGGRLRRAAQEVPPRAGRERPVHRGRGRGPRGGGAGRGLGLLPEHGPGLHVGRAVLRAGLGLRRVRGPLRGLHEDAAHRRSPRAGRGPRPDGQRRAAREAGEEGRGAR